MSYELEIFKACFEFMKIIITKIWQILPLLILIIIGFIVIDIITYKTIKKSIIKKILNYLEVL